MPVILDSTIVVTLSGLKGDGYRCWGDKDPNNAVAVVAGPPQYAFIDTRQRFVLTDAGREDENFPYGIPPLVGFRFPRPIDRFSFYLAEQKAEDNIPDPTPPGIRFMVRAGNGNYQSRIWQGDFLQPVYANPPRGSGNNNQERGRIVEICGPMADQWEIFALSITGSGGRVAAQQMIQIRVMGMVSCVCDYSYHPGPNVTQTFPAP